MDVLTAGLIVRHWRAWLAIGALGSALTSCYLRHWAWAVVAGVFAVLPAALWMHRSMADTREMMEMLARPGRVRR